MVVCNETTRPLQDASNIVSTTFIRAGPQGIISTTFIYYHQPKPVKLCRKNKPYAAKRKNKLLANVGTSLAQHHSPIGNHPPSRYSSAKSPRHTNHSPRLAQRQYYYSIIRSKVLANDNKLSAQMHDSPKVNCHIGFPLKQITSPINALSPQREANANIKAT